MSPAAAPVERFPGVVVIGGGPAGLMAAETARASGVEVDLLEAKPSVGRKFLIAGRGGLNLTHADPRPRFEQRYPRGGAHVARWLDAFDAQALRDWAKALGVDTFVGSSGRVFPTDMKAAPLLRAWVQRLRDRGVRMHMRWRWTGFDADGHACFETPEGPRRIEAKAVVLALGGGSWPQLGSDGAWLPWLRGRDVAVTPLEASNCGFDVGWSPYFAEKFAGAPLKPVAALWRDASGREQRRQGECVVTATGLEGSLLYAIGADLREHLRQRGSAVVHLDLLPTVEPEKIRAALEAPRSGRSLSEVLRRRLKLDGVKASLVREVLPADVLGAPEALALALKRLPIRIDAPRPMAEAISTAGGVELDPLTPELGLPALPGWFACGEMLAWDAPTGGYLLTACFASGRLAGAAAARFVHAGSGHPTAPA